MCAPQRDGGAQTAKHNCASQGKDKESEEGSFMQQGFWNVGIRKRMKATLRASAAVAAVALAFTAAHLPELHNQLSHVRCGELKNIYDSIDCLTDIEQLVSEVTGLFAGGELSEESLEGAMKALNDAYWIAKEKNRKYAAKKNGSTE